MTVKWLPSYAPVDEEFGNVSLLLHGDGTNGSTTIVDSSPSPKAITVFGDAQISTAIADPFGGTDVGVLAFDGAGDYITTSADSAFQLGTGDFTVEFWARPSASNDNDGVFTFGTSSSSLAVYILNNSWRIATSGSGGIQVAAAILNTWQHVAVTRSGTSLRFFLNGIQSGLTISNSTNFVDNQLNIGYYFNTNFAYNGFIDEFRLTKSLARYTSNFTPPTAPFPDLSPSGRITIEDNSLDVDARQYIINVEEQDGQSLESGVRTAISDFVVGCKTDGIWDAIKASCILAGARTLDGALVPLVGGAPTNNNFVSGDYDRETGLVGDGSTKYLGSSRNNTEDPQDNTHHAVYASIVDSGSTGRYIEAGGFRYIESRSGELTTRVNDTTSAVTSSSNNAGFIGVSRSSLASYILRASGSDSTKVVTSNQYPTNEVTVFGSGSNKSSSRIAFYSIGESLDLAALDTRVSNLITAIGAAIP
jgi:hypothetical protein